MSTTVSRRAGQPPRPCVTTHLTDKGTRIDTEDAQRISGPAPKKPAASKRKGGTSKEDDS